MRLLIALITATASLAAAPMDQDEQRLGFVTLSDGKTFDGWKHPGNWEIQDGAFARVTLWPADLRSTDVARRF